MPTNVPDLVGHLSGKLEELAEHLTAPLLAFMLKSNDYCLPPPGTIIHTDNTRNILITMNTSVDRRFLREVTVSHFVSHFGACPCCAGATVQVFLNRSFLRSIWLVRHK